MAYFLRQFQRSRGTYLQIVESFWDDQEGKTKQKSYETLGYISDLQKKGIADPVAHYTAQTDRMNARQKTERAKRKARRIGKNPKRFIGYFLLKGIYTRLRIERWLRPLEETTEFDFSLSRLIEALIYARVLDPRSKRRTWMEVLPLLYEDFSFSYGQILRGISWIGREYEKLVELFTHQLRRVYGLKDEKVYMDCTNYWFEIDREDMLRRKGPSKENRHDPIVGLGLLLDADQIPVCMRIYPGNESEKPVLRTMIRDLKQRCCLKGKTIQVADKGLNCAENIVAALAEGDGYLFSKSVLQLPAAEQKWVLHDRDWEDVTKDGKLLYRIKDCIDEFPYKITNIAGRKGTVLLKEKRVVTYNPSLAAKKKREIQKLVTKAKQLTLSQAKRSEYGECSKFVTFAAAQKDGTPADEQKVQSCINEDAVRKAMNLAGYNLLVTSEVQRDKFDLYHTYHNLWVIEESFKLTKSYLDARPVFLQKASSIQGHFFICYAAVFLIRILQKHVLDDAYSAQELFEFIRRMEIVKAEGNGWINLAPASEMMTHLGSFFDVPINNYFLTTRQINEIIHKKI